MSAVLHAAFRGTTVAWQRSISYHEFSDTHQVSQILLSGLLIFLHLASELAYMYLHVHVCTGSSTEQSCDSVYPAVKLMVPKQICIYHINTALAPTPAACGHTVLSCGQTTLGGRPARPLGPA